MIQDGWENILSLGIKTSNSVFLPVYSAKLEGRFDESPSASKSVVGGKTDSEMEVEVEEPAKVEKKDIKQKTKSKSADVEVKEKKKSSTIGSGSAARKSKAGVVGTPKAKASKKA